MRLTAGQRRAEPERDDGCDDSALVAYGWALAIGTLLTIIVCLIVRHL